MSNELKQIIKIQVSNYVKLFPGDYDAVKQIVVDKRILQAGTSSGLSKGDNVLERQLLEYSQILYNSLMSKLEPEDFTTFSSKEGQRWFAKEYPEFRIPKEL